MARYNTKDALPPEIAATLTANEVFVDDALDATWASIIYHADTETFCIYVDMSDNGGPFVGAISTLTIHKDKLRAALNESERINTKADFMQSGDMQA